MGSEAKPSTSSSSSTSAASPPPPPPPPAAAASSSSSSPSGKRSRDPEDEVYVDNLHSHKRYLSEIMASSLNGLTVGDAQPIPLPHDNLMESPARSETMFYLRDEMSLEYSSMSEDSDDSRYFETSNMCSPLPDSRPTSPVSPYRNPRPPSGSTSAYYPAHSCPSSPASTSTQPRRGGSDSEGRFPSSPSDICHSADLRRAALLRSVQMRTQPTAPSSSAFDLQPLNSGQQEHVHGHHHNMEAEYHTPCTYVKSVVDDPRGYQIEEECSVLSMESESHGKPCETLGTTLRGDDPGK